MPEEIITYATRFRQHDVDLYLFRMNYEDLLKFVEVIPHSELRPDYPQRPIDDRRLREIAEYVSDGRYIPPALVLTLYDTIGREEIDALGGMGNIVKLTIPIDGRKHAYCLDGQHRLWAFDQSRVGERLNIGNATFQYAIVAFYNVPFPILNEQYITINTKQEKVNRDQITTMRGRHLQLEEPRQKAFQLAQEFNNRQGSVFQNLIFFMPGQRNRIIRVNKFIELMLPYLVDQNALLGSQTVDDIYRITNAYFKAWRDLYPDAWKDTRRYVLLKTAGLETMFRLLEPAYIRCRTFYSANLTQVDTWMDILRIFETNPIDLTQPGQAERKELVDWKSDKYRQFCSGRVNIDFFVRAVKHTFDEASPTTE